MSNMFNARLKVLTVSEIEAAFGSKMVINEQNDSEGRVCIDCNFELKDSPFGQNIRVVYVNPEFQCDENGTISSEVLSEVGLFAGGSDMPWFLQHVCEKLDLADFLLGTYRSEGKFTVPGSGIETGLPDVLLRISAGRDYFSPKFVENLRKTAKFFDTVKWNNEECYVIVLGLSWKITKFGNRAKGEKSNLTECDVEKVKKMLFPKQFQHLRSNNGVYLSRGWLVDEKGNSLKPTLCQPSYRSFSREVLEDNAATVEIWTDLHHGDVALSCRMNDNGEAELRYDQPYRSNAEFNLTQHQLRRMEIIRKQIIADLKENARQWGKMDEFDESEICWKGSDAR